MPACEICGRVCNGDKHWLGLLLCGRSECFATAWNRKHHPAHPSANWPGHDESPEAGAREEV